MKKNNLTLGLLAALLLSSSLAVAESDYPAADFQPKVLFNDEGANSSAVKNQAKPKAGVKTGAEVKEVSVAASKTATESSAVEATKSEESGSTLLIGLLVLAAAGGFLYFKKQGGLPSKDEATTSDRAAAQAKTVAYGKDSSGLSGVTRYLKNRELLSASGVARYLAKQEAIVKEKVATTGVAKYVNAQQARSSSAGGATGVEKYLKNRG